MNAVAVPCTPDRRQTWQDILEMTRQMLQDAQDHDWVAVLQAEQVRQQRLVNFFNNKPTAQEATWLADGIREMMSLDEAMMTIGREQMQDVSERLSDLRNRKQIKSAYDIPQP